MRKLIVAVLVAGSLSLAPTAAEALAVSGGVYVQPGQQPVYGQQPVAQQPVAQQPVARQPVGYAQPPARAEERVHIGLIVSGAVMFGVSWLLHALLVSPLAGCGLASSGGCVSSWDDFRWTGALPLVGPWVQLAVKPTGLGQDGWGPYLIIDGILQAGGLTMLILGATVTETVTVYGDNERGPSLRLGLTPGGVSASGTF